MFFFLRRPLDTQVNLECLIQQNQTHSRHVLASSLWMCCKKNASSRFILILDFMWRAYQRQSSSRTLSSSTLYSSSLVCNSTSSSSSSFDDKEESSDKSVFLSKDQRRRWTVLEQENLSSICCWPHVVAEEFFLPVLTLPCIPFDCSCCISQIILLCPKENLYYEVRVFFARMLVHAFCDFFNWDTVLTPEAETGTCDVYLQETLLIKSYRMWSKTILHPKTKMSRILHITYSLTYTTSSSSPHRLIDSSQNRPIVYIHFLSSFRQFHHLSWHDEECMIEWLCFLLNRSFIPDTAFSLL